MTSKYALLVLIFCLLLSACETYSSLPLPTAHNLQSISKQSQPISLTLEQASSLAVVNNPGLAAERKKSGVAAAQAFAAGLLPDPQISATLDKPTGNTEGLINGYGLGLNFDLLSLLTQPARAQSAAYVRAQAENDMLWQEWQVIEKTKTLAIQKYYLTQKTDVLKQNEAILIKQADHSSAALKAGNITIDQANIDEAALLDIRSQLTAADKTLLQTDQDLNALLGIRPDNVIVIEDLGMPSIPAKIDIEQSISGALLKRPDLLALQDGYKSQEEEVWKAILSQFPAVSIGFTRSRDTSNVHTTSFGLSFNLPIFDRGRGAIATAKATREQLHAEYQARLDQTAADSWRLQEDIVLLDRQIAKLQAKMPELIAMADKSAATYHSGNLPAATYLAIQNVKVARQLELLDLQAGLWTDIVSLQTVLGDTNM